MTKSLTNQSARISIVWFPFRPDRSDGPNRPDDRHDRGDLWFHIIASIVSKSDTARFGPGEATLFWRESCKTKRKVPKNMHDEVWVYTEMLPLTVPYTGARASSPLSRVSVVPFWNALQKKH